MSDVVRVPEPTVRVNNLKGYITKDSILTLNDLHSIPNGPKILLVNKKIGGWAVITKDAHEMLLRNDGRKFSEIVTDENLNTIGANGFFVSLYNRGILSVNHEMIVREEDYSVFHEYRLSLLILKITNKCNLECTYCYSSSNMDDNSMNIADAKKAIDDALNKCMGRLIIIFHGGEPLLELENIYAISDYAMVLAKERKIGIELRIQSNGTMVNEDVANQLFERGINIGVSLDGYKELNDLTRIFPDGSSTYGQVMNAIKIINDKYSRPPGTLITITKHNVKHLPDIVRRFEKEGIRTVKFSLFFPDGRGNSNADLEPDPEELLTSYKEIISDIENKRIWEIGVETLLEIMMNMIMADRLYPCYRYPCGAGTNFMSIDVNGDVYPCDCLNDERFKLGNIQERTLENCYSSEPMQSLLRRGDESLEECDECPYQAICGRGCPSKAYWANNTLGTAYACECTVNRGIIEHLMWRLAESPTLLEYTLKWKNAAKFLMKVQ